MTSRTPGARLFDVAAASLVTLLAAVAAVAAMAAGTATVGCTGARGATVQAPVELAIAPIGSVPGGGIQTTGEHDKTGRCSVRLVAGRIDKSSPGCYLDEHISEAPGILYYPCGGDGPVEADFGDQRYTGKIDGGEVELELSTELDWEDGCRWGTHAVISGTLVSNGEPTLRKLSWDYKDRVITGSDCSGVCTARATIDVMSTRGRAPEMPAARDEDDDED